MHLGLCSYSGHRADTTPVSGPGQLVDTGKSTVFEGFCCRAVAVVLDIHSSFTGKPIPSPDTLRHGEQSLVWHPRASPMTSQTQHLVPFAGQTQYMQMLLEVDYMPWIYNVIASVAHWTLLAGYLIVPGTFTALQKSSPVQDALAKDHVGQAVLNTI